MKVLFASVIYKEAEDYLGQFVESINEQTCKEFEVLIINDNYSKEEIGEIENQFIVQTHIIQGQFSTPTELRIQLLLEAKGMGASILILGDCDDTFSLNRVELNIKQFEDKYTFFYNSLQDMRGNFLMKGIPNFTTEVNQVLDYNYLGMSNTTLNMNRISKEFINTLSEFKGTIFDWYLFSRLLCSGGVGKTIDGAYTFYRIHQNNLAGIQQCNYANAIKEFNVKKTHYAIMKKYSRIYEKKLVYYENSYKKLIANERVDTNVNSNFWWNILP